MAEGRDSHENRIFVGGRARLLLNAMAYFENERVGRVRAGRVGPQSFNTNRGVTRQEVGPPHGKAHALSTCIPRLGVLLSWRGRGRGLSLPTPPHFHQPQPDQQGVGEAEVSLQTPTTPP